MHCRSGVEYIAIACRGKPTDSIQPEYFASPGGEGFLSGLLNTDGTQLAQQLEAFTALGKPSKFPDYSNGTSPITYLATQEGRAKADDTRSDLRVKARRIINSSLRVFFVS